MAEREYKFTRLLPDNKFEEYCVKESDLDRSQKELMVGHFINEFSKLPKTVQQSIELQIFYKKYIKIEK